MADELGSAPWMNEELALFREVAERFVNERMVPQDARWRSERCGATRSGARPAT